MRFISSILIALISVSELFCQLDSSSDIEFSVTDHDFGSIYKNLGDLNYTFEFVNSTTKPIFINSVEPDCKCALVSWSKDSISPGAKGYIKIKLAVHEISGSINHKFIVKSNAKNNEIALTLAGNVYENQTKEEFQYSVGEIDFKSKHINIGYLNKNEIKSKSMATINHSLEPVKIEFDDVPKYIDVSAYPAILKPDSSGIITVKYSAGLIDNWDYVIDRVTPILNGKKYIKNTIAITANICEDFSKLTPEQLLLSPIASYRPITLLLDTLRSKNTIELNFVVKNRGKSDLIIRDVNPSCGCTAARPEKYIIAPGDSTIIDAKFNPKGQNGPFNYTITVITNDPKNYRQYLWLKGFIKN